MSEKEAIPHRPQADSFNPMSTLRWARRACLRYKVMILAICLMTEALVITYMALWQPIYKAEVLVAAEVDSDASRDTFYQDWNVFRKEDVPSEAQLMTSEPVLTEVVKRLSLTHDEVYHPMLRQARYIWQASWPGRGYKAVKEWIFPPKRGPYSPTPEQVDLAKTVYDFKSGVSVEQVADTHVGRVVVRGPSQRVAEMANTVVSVYLEDRRRRHVEEATRARDSLETEVERSRRELEEIEAEITKFNQDNGLLLQFEQDKVEISRWVDMQSAIMDTQAKLASLEKSRAEVLRQLELEEPNMVTARQFETNKLRLNMRESRFDLERQLQHTSQRYLPDSPEVVELRQLAQGVDKLIESEPDQIESSNVVAVNVTYEELKRRRFTLESEIAGTEGRLAVMTAAAAELKDRVAQLPAKVARTGQLDREHYARQARYLALQEKLMMAEVSRAAAISAPPTLRVAAEAFPPDQPLWPRTKLLLLGGLAFGLLAGVGLAMFLDVLRGPVTRERLSQIRADLPVYASIHLDRWHGQTLGRTKTPRGNGERITTFSQGSDDGA